jgi:nucleotide-binding universal stress UspA family protein
MSRNQRSLKTVLAATDFSPDAQEAVARGSLLASEQGAQLVLMHVVDMGSLFAWPQRSEVERDLHGRVVEQAQMQLVAAAAALRRDGLAASVRTHIATGRAVRSLAAAAEDVDLVVLGASGDHPIRDMTLGSTAEQLSRLAHCPILVARGMPAGAYRQVLVPVDFSDASMQALEMALAIAPDASFHLLHCLDLPYLGRMKVAGVDEEAVINHKARARRDAMDRLVKIIGDLPAGTRATFAVEIADVRVELLKQARTKGADLIARGKQGQSFIVDTLLGSVTAATLACAQCDVLAVPGPSA